MESNLFNLGMQSQETCVQERLKFCYRACEVFKQKWNFIRIIAIILFKF